MTDYDVFIFLKHKNFPLGNTYVKGLISSAILKLKNQYADMNYLFTYNHIMGELGLTSGRGTLLENFMKREMKTITRLSEDDLISWIRPYAKILIKNFNPPSKLLKCLNLDNALGSAHSINERINELFEMSFKEAKDLYSMGILSL